VICGLCFVQGLDGCLLVFGGFKVWLRVFGEWSCCCGVFVLVGFWLRGCGFLDLFY